MYEQMTRGLPEAREGEIVSDAGRVASVYETEIELRFGRAYTLEEVAEKLGISPKQVQSHVADGSLATVNVGRGKVRRDLRVLDDDLEGFVRRCRVGAVPAHAPGKATIPTRASKQNREPDFAARRAAKRAAMEARDV